MAISPVSSSINTYASSLKPNTPPPASSEVRGEQENDGDSDDSAVSKVTPPAPTVNTHGQTIGTILNITA